MAKKRSNESPEPLSLPDIPLDAILSFLKDTRSAVNWSARELKDCLQVNSKQAQQILAILEMQGYVAREGNDWLTTAAGESVSKSKKAQFPPESINNALETLKERIQAINRDKRCEFKITNAVAFGDFLTGRAQVQAAEVGVQLMRRELSDDPHDNDRKRMEFMNSLRRKSRLFTIETYRPWMTRRSHRRLLIED
jgi:hypothetical protein